MFVPTGEETSKVTAFVLKKFAQQLYVLEEQRRKEQGMHCMEGWLVCVVYCRDIHFLLTNDHLLNASDGHVRLTAIHCAYRDWH
jgi:hypothetical protein